MKNPLTNIFTNYQHLTILFIILISSILYQSCKPTPKELTILYDKDFSDIQKIAEQDEKQFCIVLSHPDCPPCSGLVQILGDRYRHLASKVIFNIVDVSLPENQWYTHWLHTSAFPTTCVFSSEGELQVAIPGTTEACKQCIASAIEGNAKCAAYFDNKTFPANSEAKVKMLNALLSCKQNLEKGVDIGADIQPFLNRNGYPYSLFLKILNEEKQGRHEEAVTWAKQLLSIENPPKSILNLLRMFGAMYFEKSRSSRMQKIPFYHQLDAMDCGPTCLKRIAKHYDKTYALDYLCEKSFCQS